MTATWLDLSAAFDSVDHDILLQRLQTSYGLEGAVVGWFTSYLHGRMQKVHFSSSRSEPSVLLFGVPQGSVLVPQGSVLGPILFLLYTADLLQLLRHHQITPHSYTDDTQMMFCRPSEIDELSNRVSARIDEAALWLRANRLQLNHSKTEVLWCTSQRRQHLPANCRVSCWPTVHFCQSV